MDPTELEEFIERVCNLRRRDEIDATMVAILDDFDAAGVEALVLKGPALARLLYAADEHRGYMDIDLLVAPDHLSRARGVLADLGCVSATELRGVGEMAGSLYAETWLQRKQFREGPGALMLDLHWRLPGSEAPPHRVWPVLAARRAWIDVNSRKVPVLDRPGLALHLATHAAQHGPQGLKAMGDLARGIERWPPEVWRLAARLAKEVDATLTFAAGLRLTPAGVTLARELGLPTGDDLGWAMRDRETVPRGTFHLEALARGENARERLNVLRRALLPPPAWIKWEDPSAAGSRVRLFVGYVRHLCRVPLWAARAWRFRRHASGAGSRPPGES